MIELVQEKLDVLKKERSNMFDWRGQFTPEFIEYLLSVFSKPGMVIADPFLGSGTVILESIKKDLSCVGYELNPSAYYMAKFYEYALLSQKEKEVLIHDSNDILYRGLEQFEDYSPVYVKSESYRESYKELLDLATIVNDNAPKNSFPLLINVLFLCEKDKKKCLKDSVKENFKIMSDNLMSLPPSKGRMEINLGDSRSIGRQYNQSIDLIITSPPYVNVFNYHQNYRGIIERFNYNILRVAESEFGSNRKNRVNRFRTVVQYTMDMGSAIYEASRSLKIGGEMILIVGRTSNVRNTPFYNSRIIEAIIETISALIIEGSCSRRFMNRFGETIIEDIIFVKKSDKETESPTNDSFKAIGLNQISNAIKYADKAVIKDLYDVLNHPDKIQPSPIYQ